MSVNFVSVNSVDEANKLFRVIISKAADLDAFGVGYNITIPYPTDLTNSSEYKSCLMKLETITIGCLNDSAAAVTNNPNPVWMSPVGAGGGLVREGLDAVILNMGLPSKNSGRIHVDGGGTMSENLYRYQELIPLHLKLRGNYQGIEPATGFTTPVGQPIVTGNSYAFSYSPPNESGVITAIPFGKNINFYLTSPYTVGNLPIYLGDIGDIGFQDFTRLTMSWTIELIK